MSVRLSAAVGAAASIIAITAGAAPASAAPAFTCEASALRATVLGQTIEPSVVGRSSGACADARSTPSLTLPALLNADALIATTTFDAGKRTAQSAGGVANLKVVPTADLLNQLPTNTAIDALPTIDLAPAGVPITIDVREAVRALMPKAGAPLLEANVLSAIAAGSCQDGKPVLSGASQIIGAKLAGNDLGLGSAVDQAVTLIDTQRINPGDLDLTKIQILTPLSGPVLSLVQGALKPALSALPPIELPASVVNVKLTPNEQLREGDALTQRALHAQVSLLGQSILDAVLGEAKVSGKGVCDEQQAAPTAAQQVLQCTDRKLVLLDVLERNGRVKLLGAANRSYVGRTVAIRLRATGRIVARAKVRKDGFFTTYAAMPARAVRGTNRARYRAEIGRELSLPLKLRRRLVVTEMRSASKGTKVVIAGRVMPPLANPTAEVRIVRRVSCRKVVLVKRFKPGRDGRFRVTVKAPRGRSSAVYRLVTRVRKNRTNPKTYPTFTLPRGVDLDKR